MNHSKVFSMCNVVYLRDIKTNSFTYGLVFTLVKYINELFYLVIK